MYKTKIHYHLIAFYFLGLLIVGCAKEHYLQPISDQHPANPNIYLIDSDYSKNRLLIRSRDVNSSSSHTTISVGVEAESTLRDILFSYFEVGQQLAKDQIFDIAVHSQKLLSAFYQLEKQLEMEKFWSLTQMQHLHHQTKKLIKTKTIEEARIAYGFLSQGLVEVLKSVQLSSPQSVYVFVCGMAKGMPKNGIWLQEKTEARNPYFGSAMLSCYSQQFNLFSLSQNNLIKEIE